jgi:hypothetical protein
MDFFYKLYAVWFSILSTHHNRQPIVSREVAMVASTALVLLSTLAIAFYVRFLIAICKECKGHRTYHLVRLRPDSGKSALVADRTMETPFLRAA